MQQRTSRHRSAGWFGAATAVLLLATACTGTPAGVGIGPIQPTGSTVAPSPAVSTGAAPQAVADPPRTAALKTSIAVPPGTPTSGSASTATTSSGTTAAPRSTVARRTAPPRTSAPPSVVPTADVNAVGPDNGPQCAIDPQYSDEAPTGLRPDVLAAWVALRKYAAARKIVLCLNDGKRSTAQQLALYDDYVKEFGKAAADVYVLPPGKSAHVKGYAVDVQPATAYQWLQSTNGARGWCRIYDNEPWHFEYSRSYQRLGCPARLPKPVR